MAQGAVADPLIVISWLCPIVIAYFSIQFIISDIFLMNRQHAWLNFNLLKRLMKLYYYCTLKMILLEFCFLVSFRMKISISIRTHLFYQLDYIYELASYRYSDLDSDGFPKYHFIEWYTQWHDGTED